MITSTGLLIRLAAMELMLYCSLLIVKTYISEVKGILKAKVTGGG